MGLKFKISANDLNRSLTHPKHFNKNSNLTLLRQIQNAHNHSIEDLTKTLLNHQFHEYSTYE